MAPRRIGMGLIVGLEEKLPSGFLLTTVEKLAGYMRKNSLWPATFGLACCAIEMSYLPAEPIAIISMAQHASPKVAGQSEFLRM